MRSAPFFGLSLLLISALVVDHNFQAAAQAPSSSGSQPSQASEITSPPDSKKLEVLSRVAPTYPPDAKSAGLEGRAVVKISVNESGDVSASEVISGAPVLASACESALKQWRFKPFIRNGKAIPVNAQLPCDFKIPESSPPLVGVVEYRPKSSESQNTQTTPSLSSVPDSSKLVVLEKVQPSYPAKASHQSIQGEVVVKIVVTEAGEVGESEEIRGDPILSAAVLDALKKWKFAPFIRNGRTAKAAAVLSFDFAFKDRVVVDKLYDPSNNTGPDPSTRAPQDPKRVRVSSGVIRGLLIYQVDPVYPPMAKAALIEGTVVLAAVIGKDGRIKNLRVLSGSSALNGAAIGAVQQWRYRPYVLLGEPIEVDTTITVNFTLSRR